MQLKLESRVKELESENIKLKKLIIINKDTVLQEENEKKLMKNKLKLVNK